MVIWIFNHYAITRDLPGGTRHFDFAKELAHRGHKVTIFASSFNHWLHQETRLTPREKWKIEDFNGIKFVWLRTPHYFTNDWRRIWNMTVYAIRAYIFAKKLANEITDFEEPDIILGSTVHLLTPISAYFIAKHYKAKFILEVRDLWPQTLIEMGGYSKYNPIIIILFLMEKFIYKRSEKIITALPLAHEYIIARGIKKENIIWIPNGVEISKIKSIKVHNGHYACSDNFSILYLGAHGKANALDVIIKAAKIVKEKGYENIKFVFVGNGPEKPRLIDLAKRLGLENIEFHDPVPKEQTGKYLMMADAAIAVMQDLPLYRYGMSLNKIYDYLAYEKPLIFAGHIPYNPVVECGCGITVSPQRPKELSEAIITLFKMPAEERKKMGMKGRKYIEKYHDIKVLTDKIEECINELYAK